MLLTWGFLTNKPMNTLAKNHLCQKKVLIQALRLECYYIHSL